MISHFHHLFSHHHSNNHKAKILHVDGLFVLFGVLLASHLCVKVLSSGIGPLPAILGFSSSILADEVVKQTNATRAAQGLGALEVNPQLVAAALAKGNNMCADQYWAHISPSGLTPWVFMKNAGYRYAVAGENLARDFVDTQSMVAAWMASPTHRANIVNGRYREIGIAVVNCKLLGSDTAVVVQMFGTRLVAQKKTAEVKAIATEEPSDVSPNVEGQESVRDPLLQSNPTLSLVTPVPTSKIAPLFTPVQAQKSVIVAILGLFLGVLLLDMWLVEHNNTVRTGSRSLGHFIFFAAVFLVIVIIKAGVTL